MMSDWMLRRGFIFRDDESQSHIMTATIAAYCMMSDVACRNIKDTNHSGMCPAGTLTIVGGWH